MPETPFLGEPVPALLIIQTSAEWATQGNFVPAVNQICRASDTRTEKTGDGIHTYDELDFDTPDGSPFTGDAIADLPEVGLSPAGVVPWVLVTEAATATGIGTALDQGTAGVSATGYYEFAANPSDGDALPSINGTPSILFSSTLTVFPYVQIQVDLPTTLQVLGDSLNANKNIHPSYAAIAGCEFEYEATQLTIIATTKGEDGNDITLGDDTANITRSAATLEGGVDAAYITVNGLSASKTWEVTSDPAPDPEFYIYQGADAEDYAAFIAAVFGNYQNELGFATLADTINVNFTALAAGEEYNDITMSTTDPNLSLSAALTGGATAANTLHPTTLAAIQGSTLDLRGNYDASSDEYPSTGGSGAGGDILQGDFWIISVEGELDGETVRVGSWLIAVIDTPGQVPANWAVQNNGTINGTTGATTDAILRADGTSGGTIQASLASVSDDGIVYAPNIASGLTITVAAAGNTVLTAASNGIQQIIGNDVQTFTLPETAALPQIGTSFYVLNNTSGNDVTVNDYLDNLVATIKAGDAAMFIATSDASETWRVIYNVPVPVTTELTNYATANLSNANDFNVYVWNNDDGEPQESPLADFITRINNTTENAIPKQGAVAGQLEDSQITDDGTDVDILAAGTFKASGAAGLILNEGLDNEMNFDGGSGMGFFGGAPTNQPVVPATPTEQDIVDALLALNLISQAP